MTRGETHAGGSAQEQNWKRFMDTRPDIKKMICGCKVMLSTKTTHFVYKSKYTGFGNLFLAGLQAINPTSLHPLGEVDEVN